MHARICISREHNLGGCLHFAFIGNCLECMTEKIIADLQEELFDANTYIFDLQKDNADMRREIESLQKATHHVEAKLRIAESQRHSYEKALHQAKEALVLAKNTAEMQKITLAELEKAQWDQKEELDTVTGKFTEIKETVTNEDLTPRTKETIIREMTKEASTP